MNDNYQLSGVPVKVGGRVKGSCLVSHLRSSQLQVASDMWRGLWFAWFYVFKQGFTTYTRLVSALDNPHDTAC